MSPPRGNPRGTLTIFNPSTTCLRNSPQPTAKIPLCVLKTVRMHAEFSFFGVINPLFWAPVGYCKIVNPSMTCPHRVLEQPEKFEFRTLKTVRMHWDRQDRDRQSSFYADIIIVFLQLFGAKKLADWCKWYITGNYQEVLKDHSETLDALSEELQLELLNSMWPPEW